MASSPPDNYPQISPYLLYEDASAALDWLKATFGFTERMRMADEEGRVKHAEIAMGDGVVMLGEPASGYKSPKQHGHVCQLIHVYVDDVDGHFAKAKAAGAVILSEPQDKHYGDRSYAVEDIEGQHWYFAQHAKR